MSAGDTGSWPASRGRAGGRDSGEGVLGRAAVLGSGVPGTGASRRGRRRPRSAGTAPGDVGALPGLGGARGRSSGLPPDSERDKSQGVRSQLALPPVRRKAAKKKILISIPCSQ